MRLSGTLENYVFPRVGGAPARSSPARAREDGRQDEGGDGGFGPEEGRDGDAEPQFVSGRRRSAAFAVIREVPIDPAVPGDDSTAVVDAASEDAVAVTTGDVVRDCGEGDLHIAGVGNATTFVRVGAAHRARTHRHRARVFDVLVQAATRD